MERRNYTRWRGGAHNCSMKNNSRTQTAFVLRRLFCVVLRVCVSLFQYVCLIREIRWQRRWCCFQSLYWEVGIFRVWLDNRKHDWQAGPCLWRSEHIHCPEWSWCGFSMFCPFCLKDWVWREKSPLLLQRIQTKDPHETRIRETLYLCELQHPNAMAFCRQFFLVCLSKAVYTDFLFLCRKRLLSFLFSQQKRRQEIGLPWEDKKHMKRLSDTASEFVDCSVGVSSTCIPKIMRACNCNFSHKCIVIPHFKGKRRGIRFTSLLCRNIEIADKNYYPSLSWWRRLKHGLKHRLKRESQHNKITQLKPTLTVFVEGNFPWEKGKQL